MALAEKAGMVVPRLARKGKCIINRVHLPEEEGRPCIDWKMAF